MDDNALDAPYVYVVVLNWNGWRDTVACLATLRQLDYGAYRIVVVDNGSTDGSEAKIRELYPEVSLLQTGANLGFAAGNNAGIREALAHGARYVWILNNDTRVSADTLKNMVAAMERCSRLGVVGPTVYNMNTGAPEPLNRFPPGLLPKGREHAVISDRQVELLDVAPGCSLLIRAGLLSQLEGFDERYFHYFEDTAMCWSAWSNGWLVGRTCEAEILHSYGASTAASPPLVLYYMLRNLLLFASHVTGVPVFQLMVRRPVLWAWALGPLFGIRSFRTPARKMAVVRAVFDAVTGRDGRCPRYSSPQAPGVSVRSRLQRRVGVEKR